MSIQSLSTGGFTISSGTTGTLDSISASQLQTLLGFNILDNDSTVMGREAGRANQGRLNTIIGLRAGLNSALGTKNLFLGDLAGANAEGADNMLIGNNAGAQLGTSRENIFIGNDAGAATTALVTDRNTVIGHFSGTDLAGIENVLVGHSNTTGERALGLGMESVLNSGTVGVGATSFCSMDRGVSVGFGCTMLADFVAAVGANNTVTRSGRGSTLVGPHITNSGAHAVIVRSASSWDRATPGSLPEEYSNAMDSFLNVHAESRLSPRLGPRPGRCDRRARAWDGAPTKYAFPVIRRPPDRGCWSAV